MANPVISTLISLIGNAEDCEVRRAAVRVTRALQPHKDRALNRVLLTALDDNDLPLRQLAIEALGQFRAEEALPRLVRFVQAGGLEVEAAVTAIGQLGARGAKALGKVMHEASPVLRRRIAAALAHAGTESAVLATAEALLDEDAGVVEASAKSLAVEVPQLSRSQQRALAEHLLQTIKIRTKRKSSSSKQQMNESSHAKPDDGLSPSSEAAILRVLSALHAPESENLYWDRLDSERPAATRAASLNALAAFPAPSSQNKIQALLACAADADFQVVAPALMLLKRVPATQKNLKQWLALFEAPDVAAHMFAVEQLRNLDASPVAKALLKQLNHPDKALRDAALSSLCELSAGRDELFSALLASQNPQETWTLARAQQQAAKKWNSARRARVFAQACEWHDSDDRRADALWFLLTSLDREDIRDKIEKRAQSLRQKEKFTQSVSYWRLLTRDPAVGSPLRFELAATSLKLSSHDTSASAREADPTLEQFNRMIQDSEFDLIRRVRGAKWLDENDLFYLGFHFAEQPRLAREFGRQVLELVIQRSPRSQLAKNAKHKLKSEGLSEK